MSVVLKPGWLYFLRLRDFRTGQVDGYVKIGLTNFERPVEERVDDHQTGNPREVFVVHDMQVSAINTIENYLHSLWAPQGVHGEWFEMDAEQVLEAIGQATALNQFIEEHRQNIEIGMEIYNQASSGQTRQPTNEDVSLGEEWLDLKRRHVIAKGTVTLHSERLRRLMGNARGIGGVVDFEERVRKSALDKKAIQQEHPDIVKRFTTIKTALSGKFSPQHTNPQLKGLDAGLDKQIKDEKSLQAGGRDPDYYSQSQASRTAEIESAHSDYLSSLGEERTLKIHLDLIVDRAKAACGLDDGVGGLCTWVRKEVDSESVDWGSLAEERPDIAEAYITDEKRYVAVIIKPFKPY